VDPGSEPGPYPGYTLLSPLHSTDTTLVDLDGNVVKTWTSAYGVVNAAYLLEDGSILRGGKARKPLTECRFIGAPGMGGVVERIGWDGVVAWRFFLADNDHCLQHDIELLPNENTLICEGDNGYVFEVSRDGQVVSTYQVPDAPAVFRAYRYPADYAGLSELQ
jgi:hypothetical protein